MERGGGWPCSTPAGNVSCHVYDGTIKSCQPYLLVVWGTSCSLVSHEHDSVLAMHMAKQSKLLSILSVRFRGTMALPGINSHGTVHTTHEKAPHAGPAARNPTFLLSQLIHLHFCPILFKQRSDV